MSETAQIIAAVAAVITALGTIIVAISKLGPVIIASNKFLSDKHKRDKDAKKNATAQSVNSIDPSTPRHRNRSRWPSISLIGVSILILTSQNFIDGPATPKVLVTCFTSGLTIIVVVQLELFTILVSAIRMMIESNTQVIESHTNILERVSLSLRSKNKDDPSTQS